MMKIRLISILVILVSSSVFSQEFKKLKVFTTDEFDKKASITIEEKSNDPVLAVNALKNGLVMNGFKVISERVARDKVELENKGQVSDSTFSQDVSLERTKYLNSVYVITFSYTHRADTGCGGRIMKTMSGQIVDLDNDGQIVGTFSFSQGAFEGKCTDDIMNSLASQLKSQ